MLQLLQGSESLSGRLPESEAIPAVVPDHNSTVVINEKMIPIAKLLGCNLPPTEATIMLFDVFINSVHWFMMVFHEPSLRAEIDSMLATGCTAESNLSTVVLILVVLLIGTKYTTEQEAEIACPEINLELLQSNLLKAIESNFLLVMDQDNTATIQVCILLSSFYFFHGRPNRCLAINSAAIRIAQNLKLHQESRWRQISVVERETRRRVWWALYMLDVSVSPFQCNLAGRTDTLVDTAQSRTVHVLR